jgi:tagatose-6-phosphate ketose/aldose isomerase
MAKLGRDESELQALGALWTAREIAQQPAMLRKTHAALLARKDALERFLRPLLERAATRAVLTGAGTSAFIGECLAPHRPPARAPRRSPQPIWCPRQLYFSETTRAGVVR